MQVRRPPLRALLLHTLAAGVVAHLTVAVTPLAVWVVAVTLPLVPQALRALQILAAAAAGDRLVVAITEVFKRAATGVPASL